MHWVYARLVFNLQKKSRFSWCSSIEIHVNPYESRLQQKCVFFVNANNKKPCTKFSHSPQCQPQTCRICLWNSSLKTLKIQTLSSPFWTVLSSKAAISWRHSVWEILSKWLLKSLLTTIQSYGCFCFFWAILFSAKHAPNYEVIALKIVKFIIAFLLPANL